MNQYARKKDSYLDLLSTIIRALGYVPLLNLAALSFQFLGYLIMVYIWVKSQ